MMDFGPGPEPKPEINPTPEPRVGHKPKRRPKGKKLVLIALILIILGLLTAGIYFLEQPKNPLPANIQSQMSYKAIYPSSKASVDASSYQYQEDSKTLTFNVNTSSHKIIFTEQTAPNSVSSGNQVYYPALGLHPYAQFQSKLGPVALARFYQTSNFISQGQSAILVDQGTLVIAHTDSSLTNAQWKDLFDSLKISK